MTTDAAAAGAILRDALSRPLTIPALFASSWSVVVSRGRAIALLVVAVFWPLSCLSELLTRKFAAVRDTNWLDRGVAGLLGLVGLIGVVALVLIVDSTVRTEPMAPLQALAQGLRRWPSALWTQFVAMLIVAALSLCFIVPGLIWHVYYTFSVQVVALEDLRGKRALDASKRLVQGRWWWILGVTVLLGLVWSAPYWLLSVIWPNREPLLSVQLLVSGLLNAAGTAYLTTAMTLVYLHLNPRRLLFRAETAGQTGVPAPR